MLCVCVLVCVPVWLLKVRSLFSLAPMHKRKPDRKITHGETWNNKTGVTGNVGGDL